MMKPFLYISVLSSILMLGGCAGTAPTLGALQG